MYGDPLVSRVCQFGYRFFGPFLLDWYNRLSLRLAEQPPGQVYCLGREGWNLVPHFNTLSALGGGASRQFVYLQSSRALLTHISLTEPKLAEFGFSLSFDGTVRQFFESRLGVGLELVTSGPVGDLRIRLPRDRDYVMDLFTLDKRLALALAAKTREAYGRYLAARGLVGDGMNLLCDLGFRGTIQALVSELYSLPCRGFYALLDPSGVPEPLSLKPGTTFGLFSDAKSFGDRYLPLDASLLLEAFLTAPFGQVIGMEPSPFGDAFLYRKPSDAQRNFEIIAGVMHGALKFSYDHIDLIGCRSPLIDDLSLFFEQYRSAIVENIDYLESILQLDDSFYGNEYATAGSKL